MWFILAFFALLVPLASLAVPGNPKTGILLALLQNLLMLALGYIFRHMLDAHNKMKQLLKENKRQFQIIQEQNRLLVAHAEQVEQLTQLAERNRMARELHDTVGHTFTSVIMGMDAVSYLIGNSPDKAREKLDVLRQVARKGLAEVRRSIHQIAPEGQELPLSQHIARITNEFSLYTGTSVSIYTEGEVPRCGPPGKVDPYSLCPGIADQCPAARPGEKYRRKPELYSQRDSFIHRR